MKLFDYLESSYAKANIDVQKKYSPYLHAETQALSDLTNLQRKFFKLAAYFKIMFQYLMVVVGLSPKPQTAAQIIQEMNDKAKAEKEAAQKERADKALALVPNENAPA